MGEIPAKLTNLAALNRVRTSTTMQLVVERKVQGPVCTKASEKSGSKSNIHNPRTLDI